jgi:SAM-dependent methyltransferase
MLWKKWKGLDSRMEAYTSFAMVYDTFMDNIPYDEWGGYLVSLLREHGVDNGLLLELGCGTGTMTTYLANSGYDMIGVDNSEEMLQIAMDKTAYLLAENEETQKILYLLQDMREFELYGTVKGIVSVCDSMNYILEEEELLRVFRLVNNYLDPKGIFIFDLNTKYKYEQVLGDSTIAENRDESSFIWDNYYDDESEINEYHISIFQREEDNLYRKYEETHYQRAYELERVVSLIEEAGMEFVAVYDAFTRNSPEAASERVYFIARESGK